MYLGLLSFLLLAVAAAAYEKICAVKALGGGRDDGPSINAAFQECSENSMIILDSYYSVNTLLLTEGLDHVDVLLSGTVQYTPNIAYWSPNSLYLTYQNATTFWFMSGNDIHIFGGGTIDGNGQVWYDAFNETQNEGTAGSSTLTFARPVILTIGNASNVIVEDITEIAAPNWNNVSPLVLAARCSYQQGTLQFVYQSTNVTYRNIKMSKSIDGWDIYRSSFVTIADSTINNGDDCVSFKPNCTDMIVTNLWCNGSHGISVGSLGQYAGETDIVANVFVKNVTMRYAENGARIKVFGGSPDPYSTSGGGTGYVQNITFEDFYGGCLDLPVIVSTIINVMSLVYEVDSPIITDQCYFTSTAQCEEYPSKLTISDVHYINVTGTSSGAEGSLVVDLVCSEECQDITATGTNLTAPDGQATYICENIASVNELDFNCTSPTS
ncbi:uncharacterized protein FIBRA_01587 [Fibroporia radiculosa]|uniref:galacturonan 1,4-alpha-galacturonidase n=1 Tax=Fibroporia radiculosa TaxID=599839 RepID=J4H1A7_9APHY|nr:uncharacterized protein FIBRA_01587 [Fibroporia radiculosa]CCL99569.1 predicted protein [Fibroporia radiculosa]